MDNNQDKSKIGKVWKFFSVGNVINFLFSGIGITISQWAWEKIGTSIKALSDTTIILGKVITAFVILDIGIGFFIYRIHSKRTKALNNTIKELKENLDDLRAMVEDGEQQVVVLQSQADILNYMCEKYESLDNFYKKMSSTFSIKSSIQNELIAYYIDALKQIVEDNVSSLNEKIKVSIFEEKPRNKYKIYMSTYHTQGKINALELNGKSFVSKVFKSKKLQLINDLDNLSSDDKFIEIAGRTYKTMLGIPYVIDDICKIVVVVTAENAGALSDLSKNYQQLLERYVEVIGYIKVVKEYIEVEENA